MGLSTRTIWMIVSIFALLAGQVVLNTNAALGYGMMSLALVIALVDSLLFPVPLRGARWISIGLLALIAFALLPDPQGWFFLGLGGIYLVTGLIAQRRLAAAMEAAAAMQPAAPYTEATTATESDSAADPVDRPHYLTAGLIGLGAAIVGAAAWWGFTAATGIQFGLVAWVVGRLVGMGTYYGAGNRTDRTVQIIGAVLGGLGILGGQYLSIRSSVMAGYDLTDAQLIRVIVAHPDIIGLMGLIFILFGIWDAWRGASGITLGGRRR